MQQHQYDVLVIGSGAAGLTAALNLPSQTQIAVLSKSDLLAGSTYCAQGGIAVALNSNDSIDNHLNDTLKAGAGLCHEQTAHFTVNHSHESIQWLIQQGVPFSKNKDEAQDSLHLTWEGGHSHRRIAHVADITGRAIATTLINNATQKNNIDLFENLIAIDLITMRKLGIKGNRCLGAYVLNQENHSIDVFKARFVILATGGASKVYLYTSNQDGASGDGIAMAWRAGCRISNMEFNQFHPTCLYHPQAKSFLISEAVRGEGGRLLLPDGNRFMPRFDDRGELAPRDIVARAMDHEMKRLGSDYLYLDISHRSSTFILDHFPNIHERCQQFGIDMTQEPIPVVPAAHYTCGGIIVNQAGQTDLHGLYAIGECSSTGLHGANRLASNSLLECIVFALSAAQNITQQLHKPADNPEIHRWDASQVTNSNEDIMISHNWEELRRVMWDYVGIVRTTKRLHRALHRIMLVQQEIHDFYSHYKISSDLIELRNLALVAELIIRSAMQRHESRGLHFTLDHPETLPVATDTILTPIE
ncbi:MAG: L-aspartate oxidase [Endozoicomonadaceae bacterium]|nr:L-aspartate oxidase [Endozoicomonadaceae bacterium]